MSHSLLPNGSVVKGRVIGVDMIAEILETARARAQETVLENVQFFAGDVQTLDLADDFDALIGRLVLMYLADPVVSGGRFLDLLVHCSLRYPHAESIGRVDNKGISAFRSACQHGI